MAKLIRYRTATQAASYGRIEGDMVRPLQGELSALQAVPGAALVPLAGVELLAPATPSKIVAVGPNYHAQLYGNPPPPRPYYWLKPPSAVLDPDGCVVVPDFVPVACYEVELAIVIGRPTKNVSREEAPAHILGYTCMDDVTGGDIFAPDYLQSKEFVDAKIFDTFAVLGPLIETEIDPSDLLLQARVNGEIRQHHRTSDMIFHPHELVAMISRVLTLLPGDVISTGAPPNVGYMADGDRIEIEIEGIGILRHTVSKPG